MRKYRFLLLLICLPTVGFATWQLGGEPIRTPGALPNKIVPGIPGQYQTDPQYNLVTHKGLLYDTVKQYCSTHGWKLTWMAKRDYPLNFNTTLTGPNFPEVLNQLLSHYPLQAYYVAHTVTVRLN